MSERIHLIGMADEPHHEMAVEIYEKENGGYTTWWIIGAAMFEVKDEQLVAFMHLVGGAIDFIETEKAEKEIENES
jgi:hypothetical protein